MIKLTLIIISLFSLIDLSISAYEKHINDGCKSNSHCPSGSECIKKTSNGLSCEFGRCRCKSGFYASSETVCTKCMYTKFYS